ncbi:thioredoxin family protein [Flavobacterium psychrotolerans]|uniref:Thioredoxin family protein n=1 Tax=Flavobacterium psychrotolerans TaxID=2169410 RepID=A0A2U1JGF0_9FLAO|nr:thioredoxin family protein [Flavobacterium psychrotolerans]PWA04105.1 thioredoxin family protein [Flavobacterium psychrotolerans]
MKKIVAIVFLVMGSMAVQAQELAWETSMEKAVQVSMKTKKPLLLFFTGSDWCGWCIRLQKEVLKTQEFATWAKENVVLVELDFPRRSPQQPEIQKQNNELQQLFQVAGYPTVWFSNPTKKDGKINLDKLGSTGYVAGGPSKWLEAANQILSVKQ